MTTEASIERDVKAVTGRWRASEAREEADRAERDRVYRDALDAGMARPRLAELSGLSTQRIDQIRKGTRT